ncbi:hypothetical protein fugu_019121 [Takifugu bimaculatus]|uniref:RING-type domain-containing protein n=1 Tax=Takifugu bimaculatus TaxID=433685 RepID=A0A4Z2BJE6_9TELE|nr:hypothetical protein fugu_019121 [Takifugu bimaculatus]
MSVSLVVIRVELADQSPSPQGFQYSAIEGMSDEELQEKALGVAKHTLSGKSDLERAAVLHQHIGRRAMGDMVIETFEPSPDKGGGTGASTSSEQKSLKTEGAEENSEAASSAPDSPSKQLPDHISFFSGNPSVEIVHGVMHLYKTNKMTSLTEDVRRSAMVCILTVPATMTSHDLMKLMAPFSDVMEHMKIIRDSTPNQYMVLIKFCRQADADSFYTACNGRQFNSIEDAVCQLVYVERAEVIKSEEGASLPVMDLTELPKCTVCLERMDESVNGVLTTLCNHSFHSQCLQWWEDTSCPVCRYCQTPEPVEENKCFECGVQEVIHGGLAFYNYVHRLVASKTDGKIVQYECEGDTCDAEKIDGLQLEYSYLLTSQLESQRIYWENKIAHLEKEVAEEVNNMKAKFKETLERCDNLEQRVSEITKDKQSLEKKCAQLGTRVAKLGQELKEEQEMNRCLRANQTQLQTQLAEEERKGKENGDLKDVAIEELQQQLRDMMFHLETQQQIEHLLPEARSEIQEGQINIGAGPAESGAGAEPSSGRGRRGRGRKRK